MSRTIQTTANNSGSTSIVEVGTNTGFNAGDLVYYNNGDYKGAPSLTLPTTASFPLTANMPTTAMGATTGFCNTFNTPGSYIGGSGNKCAAVLTNGNIVQVFIDYASYQPCFKIVNASDVVQVAATVITSTYTNTGYPDIGVLALTGGGFVVYWVNNSGGTTNTMNYAIYTNTGSVTTGATQDTSFGIGSAYNCVNGVGLANGTFVLLAVTNAPNPVFRGYSATGVAAYSLVTLTPLVQSNLYWVGLSARSDNSFIVFWPSSSTVYNYAIYSSAGSGINTGSITVTGSIYACDVSTLSDGTTFVLTYSNQLSSKITPCFRFLPTGNVLGAEFTVPAANINGTQMQPGPSFMSVLGLSNGNFIMTFGDGLSSYPGLNYAVYNSSGTCITGTNANGAVPLPLNSIPCVTYNYQHLMETSTGIVVHWGTATRVSYRFCATYYARISKTSYLPTALANTVPTTIGSGSAAASGIGYAGTVPTAVSVAAASSGTISIPAATAYTVAPSLLYSANVVGAASSTTLPNGNIVLVYKDSITYVIYASVFSAAGALLTTITVGTNYATTSYSGGVSVSALPSGNFVVSYYSANTVVTNALFSSSYALISTSTITSVSAYNSAYGLSVAGLTNERFVVVYHRSSQVTYTVFDGATNTALTGQIAILGATCYNIGVCANNWGGWYATFYYSGTGQVNIYGFYNSSGSTYSSLGTMPFTAGNGTWNNKPVFANGMIYFPCNSGSGATYQYLTFANDGMNISAQGNQFQGPDCTSYNNIAIGVTGLGNPVTLIPNGVTNTNPIISWSNSTNPAAWSTAAISYPSNSFFALTGSSFRGNNGYGTLPTVTTGAGNSVFVSWCDTNGYLYYAMVNAVPVSSSLITVAGVTSSNPLPVSPVAATSTTTIGGTFVGVAASTATAGSTGQIIKNGPAKLNSSYTTTASGAFDHSGTPTGGVKGTYNGSIINLQGNL